MPDRINSLQAIRPLVKWGCIFQLPPLDCLINQTARWNIKALQMANLKSILWNSVLAATATRRIPQYPLNPIKTSTFWRKNSLRDASHRSTDTLQTQYGLSTVVQKLLLAVHWLKTSTFIISLLQRKITPPSVLFGAMIRYWSAYNTKSIICETIINLFWAKGQILLKYNNTRGTRA